MRPSVKVKPSWEKRNGLDRLARGRKVGRLSGSGAHRAAGGRGGDQRADGDGAEACCNYLGARATDAF